MRIQRILGLTKSPVVPQPAAVLLLGILIVGISFAAIRDGLPVTPDLVACTSPYMREQIRRFGKFSLDMTEIPNPLNPQPLPFENPL